MNVLVVAFDGLIADTIGLRADAIIESLHTHDLSADAAEVRAMLPGRTVSEVLRELAPTSDETTLDLLALHAGRGCSSRCAQGVVVAHDLSTFLQRAQMAGTSVIVRSDSPRNDVERILALSGHLLAFRMVRCADDPPSVRGASSVARSYTAILRRLDAPGGGADRAALEVSVHATAVASRFLGRASVVTALPTSV